MQSASSRIWTCVAVSISYDDNHYTTSTSKNQTTHNDKKSLLIIAPWQGSLVFNKFNPVWCKYVIIDVNLKNTEGTRNIYWPLIHNQASFELIIFNFLWRTYEKLKVKLMAKAHYQEKCLLTIDPQQSVSLIFH